MEQAGQASRRFEGCRLVAESASRTAAGVAAAPPVPLPCAALLLPPPVRRAALRQHAGCWGGHPRAQPVGSSATTLTRRRPMARRATRAKSLPRNRLNIGADSAAGRAPPQHHGCTWCRCRCTFWGDRCTVARQVCPDCNTTGVRIVKRGTFAACFACPALSGAAVPWRRWRMALRSAISILLTPTAPHRRSWPPAR